MKKVCLFAALMLALVVVWAPASAQVIRIDYPVFGGKKFVNSAEDSLRGIALRYTGTAYPYLADQLPDSIRVAWYTTAPSDSFKADLYLLASNVGGVYVSTLIDSIKASETDYKVVFSDLIGSQNFVGVKLKARTPGNAHTSTGNKIWMALHVFYTVVRRQ